MQGLLLVDKPADWTSFDVVNYVRKMVAVKENKRPKNVKVGHSGTLDPFATGLLILMIGKDYTRRAESFLKLNKTYEVGMQLGSVSTTGDPEGEVSVLSVEQPTLDVLQTTLQSFVGEIQQVPPDYSAIKVNGQRSYDLARAGLAQALPARKVTIHSLSLLSYRYPVVNFSVQVSSGTYIRSLVTDAGALLNTGAYTTTLRRTVIDAYRLENALTLDELNAEIIESKLIQL